MTHGRRSSPGANKPQSINVRTAAAISTSISAGADKIDRVIKDLRVSTAVHYLARISGRHNIMAIVHAKDNRDLDDLVRSLISARNDIVEFDCRIVSQAVKFDSRRAPIRGIFDTPEPLTQALKDAEADAGDSHSESHR